MLCHDRERWDAVAKKKPTIKANVYAVIEQAVESGVERGWSKAHRHTDTPEPDMIRERIVEAVVAELCERLDWEGKS